MRLAVLTGTSPADWFDAEDVVIATAWTVLSDIAEARRR